MVLTRSQAAKNKANQSPEPAASKLTKQPRKQQQKATGTQSAQEQHQACASAGQQPAGDKRLSAMGLKLSALKAGGPVSHPLASLQSSPAPRSSSASPEFTIPAGVAQPQAAAAPAPRQQQQAPAEPQVQPQQQAVEEAAAPVEARQQQQPAAAPTEEQPAAAQQQQQQQQQQAPPPVQHPRPEKLLKPLPDKPVPCTKLPDGPEPVVVEVEYVASADLAPLDDPAGAAASLAEDLGTADWVAAIKALNVLRQVVVHHPEACSAQLDVLVPLVLKSVRNLRSSLCKTAIMAVADLFQQYGDALLPHTDVGGQAKPLTSLLAQILLKCSSNDKKFVIEEAQRALQVMVDSLSPAQVLPLLLPYADAHKNPKVRGKAGGAVAASASRLAPADLAAVGLPRLLQAAGKLVTDNTPDARDSAKRLIGLLRSAFAAVEDQLGVEVPAPAASKGEEAARPPPTKWEVYCQANLGASAALAVLKASSE